MLNLLLQSVLSTSFPYFTHHNISSPFCLSPLLLLPGSLIWWRFCSALCSCLGPPHPGFLSLILACLPFDVPSRLFLPFSFSLRSSCIFISLSRSGPCFCVVGGKRLKMEWSRSSIERWKDLRAWRLLSDRDESLGCWQLESAVLRLLCLPLIAR